jgi:hypothetical protein
MAFSFEITKDNVVYIYPNAEKYEPAMIEQPTHPSGIDWKNVEEATSWAEDWISAYKEDSKPFDSWIWVDEKNAWEPPISYPEGDKIYDWNEQTQSWVEVTHGSD